MNHSFVHKFISGETHFGFWNFVSKGIGLANTFLILSALTVYQYGVFQLLLASYALASNFTTLGAGVVNNDINRFIGENKIGEAKRLFFEYAFLRFVAAFIIWTIVFFGAELLDFRYKDDFILFIKLLSFLIVFEVLTVTVRSFLRFRLRFGIVASRSSMYKAIQFAALAYFLFFSVLGTKEVIISMLLGSFVSLLVLIPPAFSEYRAWRGIPLSRGRIVFRVLGVHGKWEISNQFFSKLASYIQPWLIKIFISTEAVAIFSVAQTMMGVVTTAFPTKTLSTLVPFEAGNAARMQRLYTAGSKYLFLLSVLFVLGAAAAAPVVVTIFFAKYVPSLQYFFALLAIVPVSALGSVGTIFLVTYRRQKFLFFQKVLRAAGGTMLFIVLVPFLGLWGVVAQSILLSLVLFSSMYRYLGTIRPPIRIDWRGLLTMTGEDKELARKAFAILKRGIGAKLSSR